MTKTSIFIAFILMFGISGINAQESSTLSQSTTQHFMPKIQHVKKRIKRKPTIEEMKQGLEKAIKLLKGDIPTEDDIIQYFNYIRHSINASPEEEKKIYKKMVAEEMINMLKNYNENKVIGLLKPFNGNDTIAATKDASGYKRELINLIGEYSENPTNETISLIYKIAQSDKDIVIRAEAKEVLKKWNYIK